MNIFYVRTNILLYNFIYTGDWAVTKLYDYMNYI